MIRTKYEPETDSLEITVFENGELKHSESVDFKEFMDSVPTEEARAEYLLSLINDVKKKRITDVDKYMGIIEELTKQEARIRRMMEEIVEKGEMTKEDHKKIRSLRRITQSLLDEKNTVREQRYAIKLLENTEGRLKSELLELRI